MKLYYAIWLLSATTVLAQNSGPTKVPTTTRPGLTISREAATDRITLTNNTSVQGKVTRRDDRNLYYTKPGDTSGKEQELLLSRIEQIQYADGRVEKFHRAVSPPAADYTATPSKPAADEEPFRRFHLTVGPEASLFLPNGTARWDNDYSGLGMHQNVGASARVDYRFTKILALSITGGYAQWQLVRNYLLNNTERYDETIQLTRIPIQAGVKLYAWRGLYLLPEAGVNLLTTKVTTTGTHPKPTNAQNNTMPITYGGGLGYEFRTGGLLLDLSARYQILDVKDLNFGAISPALTEKVALTSIRLGIGFEAFRK